LENKFNLESFQSFVGRIAANNSIDEVQEWVARLDLTGSKFDSIAVNGKPSNIACNPSFTNDVTPGGNTGENPILGIGTKGSITADALMRTPEIFPEEKIVNSHKNLC
jgi:hypothetical protein